MSPAAGAEVAGAGGPGRVLVVGALAVLLASPPAAGQLGPRERGERAHVELERAEVVYRPEDFTPAEASAFAQLADDGVADVEALVGSGLPPWARRLGKIRFVLSDRIDISRTFGRTVVLPCERVRTRRAPYLHEIVHALVPARGDRTWLGEGLACYLESYVSETRRGYDAHVFTRAGDRGIHAAARRVLGTAAGQAVLPWVGGVGAPDRLDQDRDGVARPFYVLSHSLTKYVVEAAGLVPVVRALVASDSEAFRRETGRSPEAWRAAWLQLLEAGGPRPAAQRGPGS